MCTLPELNGFRPDGDPLLDLNDVSDLNEILSIRYINEQRARRAAERKSERKGRK